MVAFAVACWILWGEPFSFYAIVSCSAEWGSCITLISKDLKASTSYTAKLSRGSIYNIFIWIFPEFWVAKYWVNTSLWHLYSFCLSLFFFFGSSWLFPSYLPKSSSFPKMVRRARDLNTWKEDRHPRNTGILEEPKGVSWWRRLLPLSLRVM